MRPSSAIKQLSDLVINRPIWVYVALYCAVLVVVYQDVAVITLASQGYLALESSFSDWLLRGLLIALPLGLLPQRKPTVSCTVLWMLYLIVYAPCQLFLGLTSQFQFGDPLFFRLLVAGSFAATVSIASGKFGSLQWRGASRYQNQLTSKGYWALLIALACASYAIIFLSYGFSFRYLRLDDVYVVRRAFKVTSNAFGGLTSYPVVWCSKVINPFLLYIGLSSRRYWVAAAALVGQIVVFSITGLKESVGIIGLVVGLWFIGRTSYRDCLEKMMAIGLPAFFMLTYVLDQLSSNPIPLMTIVTTRRIVFLPIQIMSNYFDFFTGHTQYFLSHSILRSFLDRPYDLTPPYLIGKHYALSSVSSMNSNYLGDGAANFGWIGVLMASLLLGVILRFFDECIAERHNKSAVLLLLAPAFSLTNSALLTSLLQHGIGLAFVLLLTMPKSVLEPARPRGIRRVGCEVGAWKRPRARI